MELQPGQANWGEVNPQPCPGAVYLWLMRSFAPRASFVCTYRYRQPLSGAELYHYGIAALTRALGRGSVTYLGADSTSGSLEAQLVREVYARAKVPTENLAEGFLVDWRDGLWIATNQTEKTQAAPIPVGARILLGAREVPIVGVTVWQ